ncbi:FAD-binding oxidoreductase [Halobium salinum]|uniref:FAD-binding oxidoreductase n=1 Tax=Halobium salinum TaxID=1364940 RepID=A0ABD5PDF7_9EURY|nr:FAD-binding oxidoreductase [Halobium salinum]
MAVGQRRVGDEVLRGFSETFRGALLRPGDDGYDEARSVWNAMVDRRPAIIARPTGAADVIAAVNFARDNGLDLAVKGAGHNIAGSAVCDDGLVVDCALMNSVRVDPTAMTARVGPGATLGDVDHETQAFGLATPTGINSTTGIAGLTLGGGFGWLSRKYGLTVDNLRSVDIVTADGELRHASEAENPDLFWAVRGGGGNFGVVTAFEFDLHEVGPEVLSGLVIYPYEQAPAVLRHWRDFVADLPDECTVWVNSMTAPPLPFIPDAYHGEKVLAVMPCYVGDLAEGERLLEPLRSFGDPIADVVGPHSYAQWQQAFDPLLLEGARNYWKSHNFTEVTDDCIDAIVEYAERLPTPQSEIFVARMGGAANRVPADATAYPHRDAEFVMNVHTRWEDPTMDDACVAWAREFFDHMAGFATGGAYVNFISEGTGEEARAYGGNYERLAEVKAKYDPENVFRANQNVKPAV